MLGQGLVQEANPTNVALITPRSVSCPSTSQCTAFGVGGTGGNENGVVATFDPSPLTEGVRAVLDTGFATLFAGACVSSSVCVADDGENVYVFNPTDPGTPSPVSVASDDSLGGIACPAANECVAVGSDGNGFVFDPSSLSVAGATTEPLGSAAYYEIACASPTQCTAVGTTSLAGPWVAVTFNPQNPGSPQPAVIGAPTNNGLTGIACPSTSQCTAVGDGNDEITFNPADPGTPTIVPFSAPVASPGGMPLTTAEITCAAADECFATDNGTDAVDQGDPTVPGGD